MLAWTRGVLAIALCSSAPALAEPTSSIPDKAETFGAVVGPAALPAGATAAYGFVGAPEIGGGYRQGIGGGELELRAAFNYLSVAFAIEALGRFPLYQQQGVELAPLVGIAVTYDTGTEYYDRDNFEYLGLRPRLGLLGTYRAAETVRLLGEVDVPWDIAVSPSGAGRFGPLVGAGVELYLGSDVTALAMGQLGLDVIKEPLGVPQTRFGWQVKLGVGFRLF